MTTNGLLSTRQFLAEDPAGRQLSLFRILGSKLGLLRTTESLLTPDEAPWSPVPLKQARDWIRADETRQIDFVFPAVFEEDRSVKIKDIATAQGLDFISHQRAGEMIAQEFEIENYDWQTEMEKIDVERKQFGSLLPAAGAVPGEAPGEPGLATAMGPDDDEDDEEDDDMGASSGPSRVQAELIRQQGTPETDPGATPHRQERSGAFSARFRQQQRESRRALEAVHRDVQVLLSQYESQQRQLRETQEQGREQAQLLREALHMLSERLTSVPAPAHVTVEAPLPSTAEAQTEMIVIGIRESLTPLLERLTVLIDREPVAPVVHVTLPAAGERVVERTIERNKQGLISKIIESSQTEQVEKAIARDPQGRIRTIIETARPTE